MGGNYLLTEIFSAALRKKKQKLNFTLSVQSFKQSNRICDAVMNIAVFRFTKMFYTFTNKQKIWGCGSSLMEALWPDNHFVLQCHLHLYKCGMSSPELI